MTRHVYRYSLKVLIQLLQSHPVLAFESWSGVYTAAVAAQLGSLRTRLIAHPSLYYSGPDALTEVKGALAVALYAYVL